MQIEKVAVIGAGVMGSGIAAHVANAGFSVSLLDIVPEGSDNRNIIAETAVKNMLKPVKLGSPSPLMHRDNARLIEIGNIEDNLELLSDADLIIEAVLEKIEIKHDVFRKIDKVRKKNSIITSNTSTIPRELLVQGMPVSFSNDFIITHFFNLRMIGLKFILLYYISLHLFLKTNIGSYLNPLPLIFDKANL